MDTLKLFMAIPGKVNFLQMDRYGEFYEQTYRNKFENETFDWFAFNEYLVRKVPDGRLPVRNRWRDEAWSGDPRSCVIDMENHDCMTLSAVQPPDAKSLEEIEVDKGRMFGLKAYSKSLKRFIKKLFLRLPMVSC